MKQHVLKCVTLLMALCMMVAFVAGCGGEQTTDPNDSTKKTTTTTTNAGGSKAEENESTTTTAESGKTQNNTKNNTQNKTTTTTKGGGESSTLPKNLGGATIKVAGMENCYFALNASKNEWNRQIRNQLSAIAKSLNCKFSLNTYDSEGLTQQAITADRAGSKFADLMMTTLWQQSDLVVSKALQDLNSIDGLDLTKSYWDQNSHKETQLYGKNFIAYTTLDGTAANANVIFFNKTLAKQVGTSDTALYKMVKDGTWTFSQMQALSQKALKDLNGNGIDYENGTDQYGFTGVDIRGGVSYSIFKAQGGYFTKTSSNGDITYALGDAKNISALRTMQTWLLKDKSVFNSDKGGNDHEIGYEIFQDGRVLFLGWSADSATNFIEMDDDWGILPYPKADKNSDYVSVISWNTQGFSIPRKVTGDSLQNAAAVMDAIAKQFDTIRENKQAYMQSRVYRDTQTQEMLDIAAAGASIDFCQYGDLGSGGLSTIHFLFDNVSNDPATRVNSVKEEATSHLNTFLKAVK